MLEINFRVVRSKGQESGGRAVAPPRKTEQVVYTLTKLYRAFRMFWSIWLLQKSRQLWTEMNRMWHLSSHEHFKDYVKQFNKCNSKTKYFCTWQNHQIVGLFISPHSRWNFGSHWLVLKALIVTYLLNFFDHLPSGQVKLENWLPWMKFTCPINLRAKLNFSMFETWNFDT